MKRLNQRKGSVTSESKAAGGQDLAKCRAEVPKPEL